MSHKKRGAGQQIASVTSLQVAGRVVVRLPITLRVQTLNTALMSHYLRSKLIGKKVTEGAQFITLYLGREEDFTVVSLEGVGMELEEQGEAKQQTMAYIVNNNTIIAFEEQQKELILQSKEPNWFFGLDKEVTSLKSIVQNSLFSREEMISTGLGALKGLLISGGSGSGKSAILKQLQDIFRKSDRRVTFKTIWSTQLLSRVVGGAEEYVHKLFEELREQQPAVLIVEDIHLLFGKKEVSAHQTTLAALLTKLESAAHDELLVIATYNNERDLATALKGSGRFEKEVVLTAPNQQTRQDILSGLLEAMQLSIPVAEQNIRKINLRLNGFSVGEIKQLLREAYIQHGKSLQSKEIQECLKGYRPAEIKELIVQVPEVYWEDIGGYDQVKKEIKKVTELPLKHPEVFKKFGIDPIKGVLLYGPPGCSKTMMAKAIATESRLNFISIKGPELFSKYVGDSERAVRTVFKRARACSPCIIFFDEIDALATQRSANTQVSDRVLCQLLNQMDGIEALKEVVIVAATNRPQILDKALMRPGRFDYLIYVSPPDEQAREDIFRIHLQKTLTSADIVALSKTLAGRTQNYTGAEIALVCRQATLIALQESLECTSVDQVHFIRALGKIKNRLTREIVNSYEKFDETLKSI